jgi:UrcA family protein
MRCMILCALAASAILGVASPALARPKSMAGDSQMRVSVAGLNLRSEAGARMALARIRRSAGEFCSTDEGVVSVRRRAATGACYSLMTDLAVAKLRSPWVAALHEGRPLPVDRGRPARRYRPSGDVLAPR